MAKKALIAKNTKIRENRLFEKLLFAFEFFGGTSGFWISLKLGTFTSEQAPITLKNLVSIGATIAEISMGVPNKDVSK